MVEVVIENISYGLSLYFSYLLPLFDIVEKGDTIVVLKKRGWCSGLKIEVENNRARYTIPKNCSEEYVSMILGLETKGIVDEFFEEYGLRERFNYINNLVIMSSPRDKLMVFTTIFLSRNTDYYRNTVKWVKTIIENDCLSKPMNCLDRIPSYQFRQFMEIHRYLLKYLSDTGKALREASSLLNLKWVGVKSINAYLLHAYGLTKYAPIDRYYRDFLSLIGIKGDIPSKIHCLKSGFSCSRCSFNRSCLYAHVMEFLGPYNGIVQSIAYIYGRLKRRKEKRIHVDYLEKILIPDRIIDHVLDEVVELIRVVRENLG